VPSDRAFFRPLQFAGRAANWLGAIVPQSTLTANSGRRTAQQDVRCLSRWSYQEGQGVSIHAKGCALAGGL